MLSRLYTIMSVSGVCVCVQMFVEMCAELRGALEGLKLGVVMEADQAAMEHTASQCTAMLGKLE